MNDTPRAKEFYERRAKEGYGVQHPEGHIIRLYEHVLKPLFVDQSFRRMFDFGCWTGSHARYFSSKGFATFGVDIVAEPLEMAKRANPGEACNFHLIDDQTDLPTLFHSRFHLILCNQVLYFLDDKTLKKRLREFEEMLENDGVFVATMMSRRCFYAQHVTKILSDGLEVVRFPTRERLAGKEIAVRFMDRPEDMKQLFANFDCVQIGRYDCDLDLSHCTEHFLFVGRRKSK